MKSYSNYEGTVPTGVRTVREGRLTLIYWDYSTEEREIDGETVTQLVCETVSVKDADYGRIVSAIIRDRYTADDVEAILSNGNDTEEHSAELKAFQEWRAKAKEVAAYASGTR